MTCCGRLWRNLGRHLSFAHGEEVVIDPWSDFILVRDEAFTPEEWARIRHGTSSGYIVNGCRCDDCRAWHREYYRKGGKA